MIPYTSEVRLAISERARRHRLRMMRYGVYATAVPGKPGLGRPLRRIKPAAPQNSESLKARKDLVRCWLAGVIAVSVPFDKRAVNQGFLES